MQTLGIIIPTTGAPLLREAIASVQAQRYEGVRLYIVIDGPEFVDAFKATVAGMDLGNVRVCALPENVGRNGFYGHRVYAAFSHLVSTDYIAFLDQDNWFEPDHAARLMDAIGTQRWDWAFALRRVVSEDGQPLIDDESQSIGPFAADAAKGFIDTNCYGLKTDVAARMASLWHGGWGQDRVFYANLARNFPNFGCTGHYTVNYRTRPELQERVLDLLKRENAAARAHHPAGLPWLAGATAAA